MVNIGLKGRRSVREAYKYNEELIMFITGFESRFPLVVGFNPYPIVGVFQIDLVESLGPLYSIYDLVDKM